MWCCWCVLERSGVMRCNVVLLVVCFREKWCNVVFLAVCFREKWCKAV